MSRIGKQPIIIPEKVEINLDGNEIKVKGPKGELTQSFSSGVKIELNEQQIIITPKRKTDSALWGLTRALIFNMVQGVSQGFEKKLEIQGVGFRVAVSGKKLVLNIGLSHQVEIEAPAGINFEVDKNIITISGIDKQLVGQVAANVRAKKKPEPYKGKGIRYIDEVVRRKAGKKGAGSE